jgi:hypothetical protein
VWITANNRGYLPGIGEHGSSIHRLTCPHIPIPTHPPPVALSPHQIVSNNRVATHWTAATTQTFPRIHHPTTTTTKIYNQITLKKRSSENCREPGKAALIYSRA